MFCFFVFAISLNCFWIYPEYLDSVAALSKKAVVSLSVYNSFFVFTSLKLADKKTLIKIGNGVGAVIVFLIIYYAVLNPIVNKKKVQIDDMN